jgi:SulP family sulfate permease
VRLQLRRAGIQRVEGHLAYVRDLAQAREKALRWLTPKADEGSATEGG